MNIILFEDIFFRDSENGESSGRSASGGTSSAGATVFLPASDERADHIRRILKLEPGDTIKAGIVDGPAGEMRLEGYEYSGEGGKPGVRLSWTHTGPPVGLYPLILLVGYTRPISAKRILREAASLGVEHIVFTGTENGEKSYREAKLWKGEGMRRFLIDGLQQAGGTVLPKVHHAGDVSEALLAAESAVSGGRPEKGGVSRLLLDNEIGEHSLSSLDLRAPSSTHVILAVGSERGWTGRERDKFIDAGYLPATLGSRVLRTETACAAGAALSLSRMGFV